MFSYLKSTGICTLVLDIYETNSKISGYSIRKAIPILAQERPKKQISHDYQNSEKQTLVDEFKFGIGFSLYAVYYYWSHIEEAPITHRKRFIAFSQSQFQKIADFETQMQVNLLKDKIIRTNHPYYNIVIDVLQKLFNSNRDIPQLNKLANWSVSIVEDDAKNAFVLPNGQIFVFTGMLKIIENTDQLGIVLSHEMAHVLLGHAIELVSYAQILDLAVIVVMGALWAFLPTDGLAIVSQWFYQKVVDIMLHMPYNRKLEKEADFVGLELASKACFDVREAVNFWKIMEENQRKSKKLAENPPEWLSTHPSSSNRARSLDDLMPEALKTREKCQCPRLSGKDPRARHYSI
ncbi:unnamed protein product [Gordionus sp. m RMFG-2023]